MKVAALQQFLRSLVPALEAAGAGRPAAEVGEAAAALDAFQSVEVGAFATFLARAREYQAGGSVAVPTSGELQVEQLARALGRLQDATEGIPAAQQEAAAALQALAARAGLKGRLTADPKWADARALKARLTPHRQALSELAARITSPDAYGDPAVRDGIARLADRVDAASLKALAAEHGVKASARALPAKVVSDVLAKLSGHQPPRARPRSKSATVDPAAVEENARRLAALIERSVDPNAVSEADVEAELARLKALTPATLFEVVTKVGIREARASESKPALLNRVRNELTAVRRARERAEV